MIAFWNRKTVYSSYSLDAVYGVMDTLKSNKVRCGFKHGSGKDFLMISTQPRYAPVNNAVPGIANTSTIRYHLYVHKKDFERASSLLHSSNVHEKVF